MPGMHSGLTDTNQVLVSAFKTALLHQGELALLIFTLLAIAWVASREFLRAGIVGASMLRSRAGQDAQPEPAGRRVLRIGFGVIWIFDGLLQGQPAMPAGMPGQVIAPAATSSPRWVQDVVNWGVTGWSYHPVQAATAAVWIQVGIGVWLVAASRGRWSQLAGLVSVGWGLVVWVFGESFGGIFAPGLTWLFGAPGAVLLYCVAGALIVLPIRYWQTAALGRRLLQGVGLFMVGMAVLQAWPGRGFWQGRTAHGPGTLTGMINSMASTPQPHFLASWVAGFGHFVAGHGFAVNMFAVLALGLIGASLLSGRRQILRPTLLCLVVLCLADWVLIEDLGFFGGLGTDPNSMLPLILLAVGGYLALTRPLTAAEPAPTAAMAAAAEPTAAAAEPAARRLLDALRPVRLARGFGAAGSQIVVAAWAAAIIVLGAAPMAAAQANPHADTIIAQALDGSSDSLNYPAPGFTLTDQAGHQVSLASLRGKVVLLTFLDPVCTSDCPIIAQEFRGTDQMIGAAGKRVELVAVVANPLYRSTAYTKAFDRQEQLTGLHNWLFLTGSLTQLRHVWSDYGIAADILPAGGMIAHNDVAYVIDQHGHTRTELDFDPGPGTASSESSFAAELTQDAEHLLKSS
jgi:cytochrome oxidase Cu insertion factor (SCO1/SenC/PrrC family)